MEMTGSYRIAASREDVWQALNDPTVLKDCIPGCESLEKTSDTEMQAVVRSKIGPVSARFTGKVTLSDFNPPESYKITGEGSGGAAGFAKGGADVSLVEDGAETVLNYTAKAQVGGKIAQLGARLIDGVAKKMADDFFSKFATRVGAPSADAVNSDLQEVSPAPDLMGAMTDEVPHPEHRAGVPGAPATHPAVPPIVPSDAAIADSWYRGKGTWIAAAVVVVVVLYLLISR